LIVERRAQFLKNIEIGLSLDEVKYSEAAEKSE